MPFLRDGSPLIPITALVVVGPRVKELIKDKANIMPICKLLILLMYQD
jgi:predicted XRE-type DNA-binding protein